MKAKEREILDLKTRLDAERLKIESLESKMLNQ